MWKKMQTNCIFIASTFVIHPQISIFSVFKIASFHHWLQIKFSMSLFFYLFTFAISLWHREFVTADVTAVFVNNQHGIHWRGQDKKHINTLSIHRYTRRGIKVGVLSMQFVCIFFHIYRMSTENFNFYRATACNATHGIAVAILSVCPSVRLSVRPSDACIVTKLNNALRIFWYHTKRQSL